MGLLSKKQEPPKIWISRCEQGHISARVESTSNDCIFCLLKEALEAGRLLNAQKLEITLQAKRHLEEWFKYLEANPNEVISRAASRQATELMEMINRQKAEQEEVTKRIGELT